MNTFYKAFKRERTDNIRKRSFLNIDFGNTSEYIIYYQQAIEDYNHHEYYSALSNISKTIECSDIDDWKYYAFKANVLEDLGNYNEAIENYIKAIDYAENDVKVYAQYHQIAFCYMSLNDHKKAVEFYTFAIELKEKFPHNTFNQDIEGMDMGVMLGIPFERMYNNRANSSKNLNRLEEAIIDCSKALEYNPNYSNPYLLLSQIFSIIGQEEKSIQALKISASLGNTNAKNRLIQLGYF